MLTPWGEVAVADAHVHFFGADLFSFKGRLKLEDGDVIQAIDGRKPTDGGHALRILRSYKSGEKLNMQVLRQRKTLTVAVVMPDRPGWDGDMLMPAMPAMPAVPPMPPSAPVPGTPGSPGGPTTLD